MGLSIAEAGAGIVTSVDLDELKAHLNITDDDDNDELLRFLRAAEAAIGHRIGPLTPTAVTEKHSGGGTSIVLRQPRVISLTSVTYADGTIGTLSDFDLDTDTGILYWGYGTSGRFNYGSRYSSRFVTVAYTAGWTEVPADLKHAVKELVRHLWETQRGGGGSNRASFPGDDVETLPMIGSFSSWPIRVQELLAPYDVPAIA